MLEVGAGAIVEGDSLDVLRSLPDSCADLVYVDPPFNTGSTRRGVRLKTTSRGHAPERIGFGGRRYTTAATATQAFEDTFDDYLEHLRPRLEETRRIMSRSASFYLHVDPRESHYVKVLLDSIFGRQCFLNEIIWAYDFGGRGTRRWAAKHDVLLLYVRDRDTYHFDIGGVDRIPYMAPALQTPARAARGKVPTDVWWHTIVPTNSRERTGYPTQKPLGLLRRIISASSRRGDLIVDWCGGSGTTAVASYELGRRFLLVDSSAEAIGVMRARLAHVPDIQSSV